jgi:predicted XRE-type DNA-binding protein
VSRPPNDDELLLTRSSGNVFADLGFDDVEATNLLMRSDLMRAIEKWFKTSGLTQSAAAKQLGVPQSRFNLLLKSKINEFSLDALVNLGTAAGLKLKLVSSQPAMKPPRAVKAA